MNYSGIATVCVALSLLVISCGAPAPKPAETPVPVEVKPDMAAVKAEIQELESAWSAADNARDANAVAAFMPKMHGVCQTINQLWWAKQLLLPILLKTLPKDQPVQQLFTRFRMYLAMKNRLPKLENQQLKMLPEM